MAIRILFLLVLVNLTLAAHAQHKVTIEVIKRPSAHIEDKFFITGSFQRWSPAEERWAMKPNDAGRYIMLVPNIKDGFLLEFKFTRGSWKTLESSADGRLTAPRTAKITSDTTIICTIEAWRDDFPASTASPQVKLLDKAFKIPQLGREREVWIYLPKNYESSAKRYPVLYMQDGQDLFDEATSQGRIGPLEWSVDEVIDKSAKPCIVVAVAHHDDKNIRIKEYYVRDNPDFQDTEGQKYLEFLTETLKPYIDSHYRTIADAKHTALAGSSMGGLFTFYAGLLKPEIFGTLGVLSPSIWLDYRNIYSELDQVKKDSKINAQRYFFYAGGNENRVKPDSTHVKMHDDVKEATSAFQKVAHPEIKTVVNPVGRHGAVYWRSVFPEFYQWASQQW